MADAPKEPMAKLVSIYPQYELVLEAGKSHFVDQGGGRFKRVQEEKPRVLRFNKHVAYVDKATAEHLKETEFFYGKDYVVLSDHKAKLKGNADDKLSARGFEKRLARFAKQKEPRAREEYMADLIEGVLEKQ